MAKYLNYPVGIAGLDLSAGLYVTTTDAVAVATIDLDEKTNVPGWYRGVTTAADGQYWVRFLNGSNPFDAAFVRIVDGECIVESSLSLLLSGDPWSTLIPAGYSAGQAGNTLGNLLDNITAFLAQQVSLTNPQPAGMGNLVQLIVGNDYFYVDSRSISWTFPINAPAEGSSASMTLRINGVETEVEGTIEDANEDGVPIHFDISKTDIAAVGNGEGHYEVWLHLPEIESTPARDITLIHASNLVIVK